MAFIAGGVSHTHILIFKIRFPTLSQNLLKRVNIKLVSKFLTDGTHYLIIGERMKRINLDTAEQLVVDITIEVLYQR